MAPLRGGKMNGWRAAAVWKLAIARPSGAPPTIIHQPAPAVGGARI